MSFRNREFYTVRGYALLNNEAKSLTPSMEDYLEMIYRFSQEKGFVRMSDLANSLNVRPPSASKMVNKLGKMDYLIYEKYGIIQLTERGKVIGKYLLDRHEIIESFLKLIGVSEGLLEETEKIEHNISENTLIQIQLLLDFLQQNQHWLIAFKEFQEKEKQT